MRDSLALLSLLDEASQIVPIGQLKVGERCVWPILRIYSAFRLRDDNPREMSVSKVPRALKQTIDKVRSKAPSTSLPKDPLDFITVGQSSHRTDEWEGKSVNRFLDPVHHFLKGENGLHLEIDFDAQSRDYFSPTFQIAPWLEYYHKSLPSSRKQWSKGLEEWSKQMQERFNDSYFHPQHIAYWLDLNLAAERLAEEILERTQPNAVFMASFYDPVLFAFIREAKKRNIPTIDLQHGVQGEGHFGYTGWKNLPSSAQMYLPSHFFHFTQEEAQTLQERTPAGTFHEVMGNSWLAFSKEMYPALKKKTDKQIGLISLGISEVLLDEVMLNAIDTLDDTKWWIRLHPRAKDRMSQVLDELGPDRAAKCEIEVPTDQSLYQVLQQVDFHVTKQSTIAFEALDFGVHTLLTSIEGARYYQDWVQKGWMLKCLDRADWETVDLDVLQSKDDRMYYSEKAPKPWNELFALLKQATV